MKPSDQERLAAFDAERARRLRRQKFGIKLSRLAAVVPIFDALFPLERWSGPTLEARNVMFDVYNMYLQIRLLNPSLMPLLDPFFHSNNRTWTEKITRLGRPSIWKDLEGRVLVETVQTIRSSRETSLAQAVRQAVRTTPELNRHFRSSPS